MHVPCRLDDGWRLTQTRRVRRTLLLIALLAALLALALLVGGHFDGREGVLP
jgi:hypothetical protein